MFTIALRGYERSEVEEILARADTAIASGSEPARASARAELQAAVFSPCLRGYDTREVDRAVAARLVRLGAEQSRPSFLIALRGYDIAQVDTLVDKAYEALATGTATTRAAAREALRGAVFRQRIRGYARSEVDREVVALADLLGR